MRIDPWIIERLEEEERRRQEDEARRTHIELPQTAPRERETESPAGVGQRVHIVPISPLGDGAFDL